MLLSITLGERENVIIDPTSFDLIIGCLSALCPLVTKMGRNLGDHLFWLIFDLMLLYQVDC